VQKVHCEFDAIHNRIPQGESLKVYHPLTT